MSGLNDVQGPRETLCSRRAEAGIAIGSGIAGVITDIETHRSVMTASAPCDYEECKRVLSQCGLSRCVYQTTLV